MFSIESYMGTCCRVIDLSAAASVDNRNLIQGTLLVLLSKNSDVSYGTPPPVSQLVSSLLLRTVTLFLFSFYLYPHIHLSSFSFIVHHLVSLIMSP